MSYTLVFCPEALRGGFVPVSARQVVNVQINYLKCKEIYIALYLPLGDDQVIKTPALGQRGKGALWK